MNSLHDQLVALADLAAQPDPADPGQPARVTGRDLWDRGAVIRRQRRVGAAAVLSMAAVLLVLLGTATWSRLPHPQPAPADAPAGVPDRLFSPSSWLPGTADAGPLGPIAAVFPAERRSLLHTTPRALVGISATTGEYRFLDLPGLSTQAPFSLSPDGRHVAFWTARSSASSGETGVALYDTVTGQTKTFPVSSARGLQSEQFHWAGASTLIINYAEQTQTTVRGDGTRRSQPSPPTLVWQVGEAAPRAAPASWSTVVAASARDVVVWPAARFEVLDLATDSVTIRFASKARGFVAQPAVDPTGTRLAVLLGRTAGRAGMSSLGPVTIMTASGSRGVPGDLVVDQLVGWADTTHVVVEAVVGRARTPALMILDVDTGGTRLLTTFDPHLAYASVAVAADLAGRGTFPANRPPSPIGARTTTLLAALITLTTGLGLAGVRSKTRQRRRVRG